MMAKNFVFLIAATFLLLFSLLHATSVSDNNSASSSSFKSLSLPDIVEEIRTNNHRLSTLDFENPHLSLVNFAIPIDLIDSIIQYNAESESFILPEKPSISLITKLIFALNTNVKRMETMSTTARQYSYHDSFTLRLFQNVLESFDTLAILYESILSLADFNSYIIVLETIQNAVKILSNFVHRFSSSIIIAFLKDSPEIKSFIFEYIKGIFYFLRNVLDDDLKSNLVDMVFSAIGCIEDERLVWSLYKDSASPSIYIPLPLEYLSDETISSGISATLFDDLIEIFDKSDTLNPNWVYGIGLLIRFKLVSEDEILKITDKLVTLFTPETFGSLPNTLLEFIRLALLDETAQPNCPKDAVYYLSKPRESFSSHFYEHLWSKFIRSNQNTLFENDKELMGFISTVLQNLEHKYPGLLNNTDNEINEEYRADSKRFIESIFAKEPTLDTENDVDALIEYIETNITSEFPKLTIKTIRIRLTLIYAIIFNIISNIETCSISNFDKLNALRESLANVFLKFCNFSNFVPEFEAKEEIEIIIDFVFQLKNMEPGEKILELVSSNIGTQQFMELHEIYFSRIAHNLSVKPDFFPVKIDREKFTQLPTQVISSFLDTIKNYVEFDENFILFLGMAYINDCLSQNLLHFYLEKDNFKIMPTSSHILTFFSSITNPVYLEYENDKTDEYLATKVNDSRENTIKSLDLFMRLNKNSEPELKSKLYLGMIPWACARLVTFEDIRPRLQEQNQFDDLSFEYLTSFSINECVDINVQVIQRIIRSGASRLDLNRIFKFILKCNENYIAMPLETKKMFDLASSFALIVFIIRTDDQIVPVSFIKEAMTSYSFKELRVSVPQAFYNAVSSASLRESLFDQFSYASFNLIDISFVLEKRTLEGFSEEVKMKLLTKFINDTFIYNGNAEINRLRFEALCYWMNYGLVPFKLAKELVLKVASLTKKAPLVIKLSVSLIRAVFHRSEYQSLRLFVVKNIFLETDHILMAPKPAILSMINGLSPVYGEPEFLQAFEEHHDISYVFIIRSIIQTDSKRISRSTLKGALHLSDGIYNVLDTYNHALINLNSFSLPLNHKCIIFKSIVANLNRLVYIKLQVDCVREEFTYELIDHFVRVSVFLVIQLFVDQSGQMFIEEIGIHLIQTILFSIVRFIRDSNVQGLLLYHLFDSVTGRPRAIENLLELVPTFLNWRRFIMIRETFKILFKCLNVNSNVFDRFMTRTIEAAFYFNDLDESDAQDLSRGSDQLLNVHDTFFLTMSDLIQNYSLPVKYIIQTLKLMNQNPVSIDVISPNLIRFLTAAIKIRTIDISCSEVYKFGIDDCVYNDQPQVVKEVLSFLSKRVDFIDNAFLNPIGSEPYSFVSELMSVSRVDTLYDHQIIQAIRFIFNFKFSKVESLNFLLSVRLPPKTIKLMTNWLSGTKDVSYEAAIFLGLFTLNIIPKSFDMDCFAFSDSNYRSWLQISVTVIEWISLISLKYPHKFAQFIYGDHLDAFLNLLVWNLEYDGVEQFVSTALFNVLESLNHTDCCTKFHLIKSLGNPSYRSLMNTLRKTYEINLKLCSILRTWTTSELSGNLAKEVESLIWTTGLSEDNPFTDNQISEERSRFVEMLAAFDSIDIQRLAGINESIKTLRSMHQFDLILDFIRKLSKVCRNFCFLIPDEKTSNFAGAVALVLIFLQSELLLQSDSSVFVDFFVFLYKHYSNEEDDPYFEIIEILFSQILKEDNIKLVLSKIILNLRLDNCLIPRNGFPPHFYYNDTSSSVFVHDYMVKLTILGMQNVSSAKNGNILVGMDGAHFMRPFNILHESNASDKVFMEWFDNVSGIRVNDMMNPIFTENLKAHCIKRPHLVDQAINIYINPYFVERGLIKILGPCRENIINLFKLMLKSNPKLYQQRVSLLPQHLQKLMNEMIDTSFNDKKRQIVQDFVDKCQFPSSETIAELDNNQALYRNLINLLKMDIRGVLPYEKVSEFFAKLNDMCFLIVSKEQINTFRINLLTIAIALQIKNMIETIPLVCSIVYSSRNESQSKEISALLLKGALENEEITFNRSQTPFIADLIVKDSNPGQILVECFENPKLNIFLIDIIGSVLHKPKFQIDIHSAFNFILSRMVLANQCDDTFLHLICIGKFHSILSKSQRMLYEEYILLKNGENKL